VGHGILGAGMDTIPVGPRSATRKELVDQTRTDHVTDTTTVTDTTIHTATGLRITPPTTPEHTTDPRITVAPMTNTRDLPTRGARITTPDLSRKVETGETTITEVALGIIRLKVGTIRTAIGTAIQRLVMQIRRVRPSPALYTIAKDMEKRNEALRLTGRKDDSF